MRERMNTEEFAARVAAPLKEGVRVSDGFEARVMAAVADAPRAWHRRPVTLSPVRLVAMAAAFGALMALGGWAAAQRQAAAVVATAPVPDTVHIVRFVFSDPDAQTVTLAGDFNGWSPDATPLVPSAVAGQWVVELPLTRGSHEYAFVVNGQRWVADPSVANRRDEFGQESSLVRVGGGVSSGT